jgi:DNA polymerase
MPGAARTASALETPPSESPLDAPRPARIEAPRRSAPALAPDLAERERAIAGLSWSDLQQAVAGCTACGLCKTRRNTVFGVGDEKAQWMIVGEAPGAEEDARGEPFVGQAGRLLDAMLAALKLSRAHNVYIANVLKCRPPGNRNPEPSEVAQCGPHLARQVEIIKPRLILAMGRFAAQTLLNTEASIAGLRGRVHDYKGVPLIVTYHPAYLLRNLPDKAKAWEDLVFARRTLNSQVVAAT